MQNPPFSSSDNAVVVMARIGIKTDVFIFL